jgi:SAM-dependent methyltransferase
MTGESPAERHNVEIARNRELWNRKPVLARVYEDFHRRIAAELRRDVPGFVVEAGSGIGSIRKVIPDCIRTDLFPNPGIDRVENVYRLSFADLSVSNFILFDVFHHLRYPGNALAELARVLAPGGRVIVFEPAVSLLGLVVYGLMHPEPLALGSPIEWTAPAGVEPADSGYYAAQGNAGRVFLSGRFRDQLAGWRIVGVRKSSALAYVASGGYSGPQLYPAAAYPLVRGLGAILDTAPALFATRLLVVLEKGAAESAGGPAGATRP